MRQLLAHRDARLYLAGQALSLFGDSSLWLAAGIWVKTLTHSNGRAGLVFFFFTAPSVLAPALGLLVDRCRRRPLLIGTNAVTAGAVLCLLLVHGPGEVWLIDAVMFAYGLSYVLAGPAQSALLTLVVPAELLADANGALRTVQEGLSLLGPLVGAGLFVAAGVHVIVVLDALSFIVPIAALTQLHLREVTPHRVAGRWWAALWAGAAHIQRTLPLRQAITAAAVTTTVFGFGETVSFAITSAGLHRPTAFVGVLAAVQGAAAVAGGLTAAVLIRRVGEGRLMGTAMLLAAAGAMLEIVPRLAPVLAGSVLFGAAIPWLVVALMTLAQRLTPPDLQGRVFAASETLISTPQTVSIAIGAALVSVVGYQLLLLVMATVFVLAASYLLTRSQQGSARPPAALRVRPNAQEGGTGFGLRDR